MTGPRPWTASAPRPVDGPLTGPGRAVLEGYLAWQRSTLLNVCAGLTADQLASRPVPSSALSLLGLVRHLAKVERIWLRRRVAAEDVADLHGGPGDPTDFDGAHPDTAEAEFDRLTTEWQRADDAVRAIPFDHEIEVHGQVMSLQMVYVHLIGEYARHNGHADLLREAIDGVAGR